ncbi:hypothetical protein [Limnohabitans lacus]|uniref:Uncharacterized protein n=1 Tax=Limnohabitans lacus TaxID=3045173 RepID=A0ABT6X6F0_9BURK|nr:hypothetical protein [Limnohabitans sp. HM2-2]MDI9233707.1 hypothetical protein [Limnohabitans sp. HM2-2]
MTLRTVSGELKEYGPSTQNAQVVSYSYLELDGQMLTKVQIFNGVHGKLQSSLGETITLYMDRSFVVGITCADGKTYCSERFGFGMSFSFWLMLIAGLVFLAFVVGIVFLIAAFKIFTIIHRASLGNSLPNAIPLPRAKQ